MNLGAVGKKGEDMVAQFLRRQGCAVVKRNYTCRFGEIDIIALRKNLLLFVEVKTRKKGALVSATEAVDSRKQRRIILSAQDYMSKTELDPQVQPRFDVAEVTVFEKSEGGFGYDLNYVTNAF